MKQQIIEFKDTILRSWKTVEKKLIVETHNAPRMTAQDPLLNTEKKLIIQELNSRTQEIGYDQTISNLFCYYELDDEKQVSKSHEEYSCSLEDTLYSQGYLVINNQLYQFSLIHDYEEKPKLKIRVLLINLEPME